MSDSEAAGLGAGISVVVLVGLVFGLLQVRRRRRRIGATQPKFEEEGRSEEGEKQPLDDSTANRAVLSFENPLYRKDSEQSALEGTSNLYDSPVQDDGTVKHNPVFDGDMKNASDSAEKQEEQDQGDLQQDEQQRQKEQQQDETNNGKANPEEDPGYLEVAGENSTFTHDALQ